MAPVDLHHEGAVLSPSNISLVVSTSPALLRPVLFLADLTPDHGWAEVWRVGTDYVGEGCKPLVYGAIVA